jgi:hypothetical protein
MIGLEKYHGKYLGALERDLDSFNRYAGLPVEVVEVMRLLLKDHDAVAMEDELLNFLVAIPESLLPSFFARKLETCRSDSARKLVIGQLPLENFCALRIVCIFFKTRVRGMEASDAQLLADRYAKAICQMANANTNTNENNRLYQHLPRLLTQPQRFFSK